MFIRWKRRYLKTVPTGVDYYGLTNYTAEVLESYRAEDGKVKQRYIASLGSFSGYDYWDKERLVQVYCLEGHSSSERFWTSAWKKLFELKCKSEELEKIEALLAERVPMPRYCHWHPKRYRTFSRWNSNFDYDICLYDWKPRSHYEQYRASWSDEAWEELSIKNNWQDTLDPTLSTLAQDS